MDRRQSYNKENESVSKLSCDNQLEANYKETNTCGVKPKVKHAKNAVPQNNHSAQEESGKPNGKNPSDLNKKIRNWKAAGIAFRQALGKVNEKSHKLPVFGKTTSDECPKPDNLTSTAVDICCNGENMTVNKSFAPPSDDMNMLLNSGANSLDVCDINYFNEPEDGKPRTSQPLYKRKGSCQGVRMPQDEGQGDLLNFGIGNQTAARDSVATSRSDMNMSGFDTKNEYVNISAAVGDNKPSMNSASMPSFNEYSGISIDSCLSSIATGYANSVLPSTSCHMFDSPYKKAKHKKCHKSKLPVPVWRNVPPDKTVAMDRSDKPPSHSNPFLKTKMCSLPPKRNSLEMNPHQLSQLTSSSDSSCEKDLTVLDKNRIRSPSEELLSLSDAVAALFGESDGDEEESTDGSTAAVLLEAELVLNNELYNNQPAVSAGSVGSMPSLLTSSDEELAEAQFLVEKFQQQRKNQQQSTDQSWNESLNAEKMAEEDDEEEDDSLDLESDDQLLFGDLPDMQSDESQAHEESNETVRISQTDIDALSELKLESSNEEENAADADDEFECECPMCEYNNSLPDLMPRMWGGDNDDLQQEFMSVGDGHTERFRFSPEELCPLSLLQHNNILELMFQNVVLQMLAVYPDLLGEQAPPPVATDVFDNLPVITVSSEHTEGDSQCPICLCCFVVDEETKQLPCQHLFHTLCIQAWLSKSGTCPVCRHQLQHTSDPP